MKIEKKRSEKYMIIFKYLPEKRNEVLIRRKPWVDWMTAKPELKEMVPEWSELGGGRIFILYDPPDTNTEQAVDSPPFWTFLYDLNDLGEIEIIPVSETSDLYKGLGKYRSEIFKDGIPSKDSLKTPKKKRTRKSR